MAARSGHDEYVPELRRLLAWSDDRVKEQALDALIRLKARVSAEDLSSMPPLLRTQVIILAMRTISSSMLMSLLAENPLHDATWVALNESLIQANAKGTYWQQLLREWSLHVMIYVVDPGKTPVLESQTKGAHCGDSFGELRSGFPPRATYGLFINPEPGDTVLLARPKPVYYRRASNPAGCDIQIDRNDYRGEFIAFGANVYLSEKTYYRYDIPWIGVQSYTAAVDRLRKNVLADYRRVLDGLVTHGLIPPEDAALRPHILVGITDQRSNKAHDLPATPPWE